MIRQLMIAALMMLSLQAMAAEWTINGTVLEKGTRKPLQGVSVAVKDQAAPVGDEVR